MISCACCGYQYWRSTCFLEFRLAEDLGNTIFQHIGCYLKCAIWESIRWLGELRSYDMPMCDTPPPPCTQVPDQQCGERASAPEIPGFQSGVHPTRGWRIGRVLHFRCRKFDCMVLFWFCYSHIFVAATSIFGECELN